VALLAIPIATHGQGPPTEARLSQSQFWFRDNDGGEVGASGYGAPDAVKNNHISGVAADTQFRLRFAVRASQADGSVTPRLEFQAGTSCTTGNSWTVVSLTSAPFRLEGSQFFNNGDPTTSQIAAGGAGAFAGGYIFGSSNPAPLISLLQNKSAEYEWSLRATDGVLPGTTYTFRITNNGAGLDSYGVCPTLGTPSRASRPTIVRFSGRAYPEAEITIVARNLAEDIPLQQGLPVAPNGDFNVEFVGNFAGWHSYGLVIADKDERRSQTKFYAMDLNIRSLTERDIFVPPTVGVLRTAVRKGDLLPVVGYAAPGSYVDIEVNGRNASETVARQEDGFYEVLVSTAGLEFGNHVVRSRQTDSRGRESDFSTQKTFTVSKLFFPRIDLNNDGILNVNDWSIFLARWGAAEETRGEIDLNGDGDINIADFSIFLRAFKPQT